MLCSLGLHEVTLLGLSTTSKHIQTQRDKNGWSYIVLNHVVLLWYVQICFLCQFQGTDLSWLSWKESTLKVVAYSEVVHCRVEY